MDETLQGSISKFTLPDIFQLLANGRKTGTLGIQKEDDIVMVYFRQGRIVYAYGPRQNRHVGQMLRERGRLTEDQLRDAVETQSSISLSKRLGQIMIEKNYINRVDLSEVITEQIRELIYSLLDWDSGSFKFYDNQYPTREEITIDLSVENVILEGVRRLDEVNRLKDLLPDYDAPLKIEALGSDRNRDISLQTDEWNLLARIDGRKTVQQLIDESGLGEVKALEKLAALKLAGLISLQTESISERDRLDGMINRVAGLLEDYLKFRTEQTLPLRDTAGVTEGQE